jgi:transcription factor SPEECHLESS
MGDGLCELLVDGRCDQLRQVSDAEDLFSILETWEECMNGGPGGAATAFTSHSCTGSSSVASGGATRPTTAMGNSRRRSGFDELAKKASGTPVQKKQKGAAAPAPDDDNGAGKTSHIAVERNRRKQMNEHLAVLRSLMPCFYVKRVRLLGSSRSNLSYILHRVLLLYTDVCHVCFMFMLFALDSQISTDVCHLCFLCCSCH